MIIPLSARNEDRLHAYVEKLLAFVTDQNVDLDRLAYSLNSVVRRSTYVLPS